MSTTNKIAGSVYNYLRIPFLLLALVLLFNGFVGLFENNELKSISLEELQQNGVGNSRYLEVTNCFAIGDICYRENNIYQIEEIIFPVISKDNFIDWTIKSLNSESSEMVHNNYSVLLAVKRNTQKYNSNCMKGENTCMDDLVNLSSSEYLADGFTIKGVRQTAFTNSFFSQVKEFGYKVPENIVYIEEDAKPNSDINFIIMIGLGIIILAIMVKHYNFVKNTSYY